MQKKPYIDLGLVMLDFGPPIVTRLKRRRLGERPTSKDPSSLLD